MTPTNRETTPPTPNAGEWIEWTGGENPAGETLVEVEYRDGNGETHMTADELRWDHVCNDDDIIAYRLATPSPAAQDAKRGIAEGSLVEFYPDPDKPWLEKCRIIPPAAQDDPAKGLEVIVARANNALDLARRTGADGAMISPWNVYVILRDLLAAALTDHATATRQIAERDARVAELERRNDAFANLIQEQADRALAAEADAARLREALIYLKTRVGDQYTPAIDAVLDRVAVPQDRAEALAEALEALLRAYIVQVHASSSEGHADWVETHPLVVNTREALTQRGA